MILIDVFLSLEKFCCRIYSFCSLDKFMKSILKKMFRFKGVCVTFWNNIPVIETYRQEIRISCSVEKLYFTWSREVKLVSYFFEICYSNKVEKELLFGQENKLAQRFFCRVM